MQCPRCQQDNPAATKFYDDSYKWAQQQLNGIRSSDEVSKVATGFATGGLGGGLQGLQSVFAGRQVSDERDSVLAELERRMKLLSENMPTDEASETVADATPQQSGPPEGTATTVPAAHVPSPLSSLPCVLVADGASWLWLSGSCPALVPLQAAAPPAEDPESLLLDGSRGSATTPLLGEPGGELIPPVKPTRASLHPDGSGFQLPRLPR